jgi:hypothetical protein
VKINKFNILVGLAIFNSILIGFTDYLVLFMYRNNITEFVTLSGYIIFISTLGSIITKFKPKNKVILVSSCLFDIVLIIYLYTPTEFDTVMNFIISLFDIYFLIMIPFYLFLIFFYFKAFNRIKNVL